MWSFECDWTRRGSAPGKPVPNLPLILVIVKASLTATATALRCPPHFPKQEPVRWGRLLVTPFAFGGQCWSGCNSAKWTLQIPADFTGRNGGRDSEILKMHFRSTITLELPFGPLGRPPSKQLNFHPSWRYRTQHSHSPTDKCLLSLAVLNGF